MYTVRFWKGNSVISIKGKYLHEFDSWKDAWESANALLKIASRSGATEVDINNIFYLIYSTND